jgi:hypothetical protein
MSFIRYVRGGGAGTGQQPDLASFVAGTVAPVRGYAGQTPRSLDRQSSAPIPISDLRRKIARHGGPSRSIELTVEGSFFRAVLLCSGWWERTTKARLTDSIQWRDGVQHWLFSGFEQWGPSWDLNPGGGQQRDYLFGQIGDGDEADSMPVVVEGAKLGTLTEAVAAANACAVPVRMRGFVLRRQDLPDAALQQASQQWGANFDYCLMVSGNEPGHFVEPASSNGDAAMYSGYLWQCWLPTTLARWKPEVPGEPPALEAPHLNEVFFIWEHTNFANVAAINYNLDSVRQKTAYIERREGGLILVQKSSELIEGEQALSREDFYDFIARPE